MKNNLNILMIHQHFFPEPGGTAKPAYEIAKYFLQNGHEVKVITEFPNRNFQSFSNYKNTPLKSEVIDNIHVFRIKNRFKYSHKSIQRMLAYFSFLVLSLFHAARLSYREKNQIIITIQAIPSALSGAILNILFRKKHIFYCTDMMPDLGIVSGMLKNRFVIKFLRIFEKLTYNHSTIIFAVTQMMVDEIKTRTKNQNVFVMSDWLDDDHYLSKKDKYVNMLIKKYGLNGKKVLLYIGNIGFLQNIGVFVELARKIRDKPSCKDYFFIIGGTGVQAEELQAKVKEYKLTNIKFIGVVDREYVPSFLNLSHILLMNYLPHPHLKLYRSSKIFDYIVAQKPVLIGASGELQILVEKNNLGKISEPSNIDDLYTKLLQMDKFNPTLNNQALIREYSINNVIVKFEEKLIDLRIV